MPKFVLHWMFLVLALSLLTGCGEGSSSPVTACPPIKEYGREFQRKLADEIEAAPAEAVFPVVLQDYALLRHQIRAECEVKK